MFYWLQRWIYHEVNEASPSGSFLPLTPALGVLGIAVNSRELQVGREARKQVGSVSAFPFLVS